MKIVRIDKKNWAKGLKKAAEAYRLFGPVKEKDFHNFEELDENRLPDLNCLNTRIDYLSSVAGHVRILPG
jgi:sulfhydrogenase subunit beta (sulfur reductase)